MKRTLITLLLAATSLAQAVEYSTTVTLTYVMHVIPYRPVEPQSATGFVRLYFPASASIGASCRNDAADIAITAANRPMITQAQIARAQNKTITIWVESTLARPNGDTTCAVSVLRD